MNVETITSRQNPLMTHLRKLASSRSYRKKSGEYLCDGTKLLDEALKWGAPVQTVVFSDGVALVLRAQTGFHPESFLCRSPEQRAVRRELRP